jgi:hypothetical protein
MTQRATAATMARPTKSTQARVTGNKNSSTSGSSKLWKRVSELGAYSASLLFLSEVASDRLSMTQAAFFMLAATADAAGKPVTRSMLMQAYPEQFRGSVRNSYRQLLEPSRLYPKALGWLTTEENPDDTREQFLKLTDEGRAVIEGALHGMSPGFLEEATTVN